MHAQAENRAAEFTSLSLSKNTYLHCQGVLNKNISERML